MTLDRYDEDDKFPAQRRRGGMRGGNGARQGQWRGGHDRGRAHTAAAGARVSETAGPEQTQTRPLPGTVPKGSRFMGRAVLEVGGVRQHLDLDIAWQVIGKIVEAEKRRRERFRQARRFVRMIQSPALFAATVTALVAFVF